MTTTTSTPQQTVTPDEAAAASAPLNTLIDAVGQIVVGQRGMVERLVVGLITGGHVLLEGVPGLAKTLTISTLASGLDARFSRIQFTPDLLPADVVGTEIYNPREGTFTPRRGPVFANIVLADEINRAPAKVQSALLEAMQERRVTIGTETYTLDDPFLVLATQNPIEQEGTYPLPEAQVDRFMLKLAVGYPTAEEEREIIDRMATSHRPEPVHDAATLADVARARSLVDRVAVDPRVRDYVVTVVQTTRAPAARGGPLPEKVGRELARLIEFGASPRASIALVHAARAVALLAGRGFVTPADIKSVAHDVLRHRIILTYEADAERVDTDQVIDRVLDLIPTP